MSFKSHFPRNVVTFSGMYNPRARKNIKYIAIPSFALGFMVYRHVNLGMISNAPDGIYVDKNSNVVPKPIRFD